MGWVWYVAGIGFALGCSPAGNGSEDETAGNTPGAGNGAGGGAVDMYGNPIPGAGGNGVAAGGVSGVGAGGTPDPGAGGTIAAGGAVAGGGAANAGAGGDGGGGVPICGAGVIPVNSGRCAMNKTIARGTALMIDDFEDPGELNNYLGVFFADGRSGEWFDAHDLTNAPVVTLAAQPDTTGPEGNTHALRYSGTAPSGWGATMGIPVANCYDASAYPGVSFYIKGNPAAGNSQVKFSVHTPVSEPVASGGGCSLADEMAGKCYDHYAKVIPITTEWVRHNIPWTELRQQCSANPNYNPATEILSMSFSILSPAMGFDFMIDNFSFDTGNLPSDGFAQIVSEATFDEMWTTQTNGMTMNLRNPFYTYQGMVAAANSWPGFCTTGTPEQRRREAAAFLSNVAHETGSLSLVEEMNCQNDTTCTQYGMAPNGNTYHGRGPIQLTHGYNYGPAGQALGVDLTNNPRLVEMDPAIAFGTAMWFWMTFQSGKGICHEAINASGLGATIDIINGIECNGGNPATIENRIKHYRRFCNMLGVAPGPNLGC